MVIGWSLNRLISTIWLIISLPVRRKLYRNGPLSEGRTQHNENLIWYARVINSNWYKTRFLPHKIMLNYSLQLEMRSSTFNFNTSVKWTPVLTHSGKPSCRVLKQKWSRSMISNSIIGLSKFHISQYCCFSFWKRHRWSPWRLIYFLFPTF